MKKFKSILLVTCFLFSGLLCGCFDNREIDETAYIIAIGIDPNSENDYSYTFQFSKPISGASSEGEDSADSEKGGSKNTSVTNITVTAPDFYVAKNMVNNFLAKNIDMSHLKLIVFAKDIDPDGLSLHSQFLLREREIRPHTAIAVAAETAKEYLDSVNPDLEANTAKYYELMALRSNNVYAPDKTLSDFVDEINTLGEASALPIADAANKNTTSEKPNNRFWVGSKTAAVSASQPDFRGMAIFKGGELCGIMDGDDAMLYNILEKNIHSTVITVRSPFNPSETLSFRLLVNGPAAYVVDALESPCLISVSQALGIEFLGGKIPDGFKNTNQLFDFVQKVINTEVAEFLTDISHTKKVDILRIGNHFRKNFLTQKNWEEVSWSKLYETAKFNVNIYFE